MRKDSINMEEEILSREQKRANYEKAIESMKEGKIGIPFVLANGLNNYYGETNIMNNL